MIMMMMMMMMVMKRMLINASQGLGNVALHLPFRRDVRQCCRGRGCGWNERSSQRENEMKSDPRGSSKNNSPRVRGLTVRMFFTRVSFSVQEDARLPKL